LATGPAELACQQSKAKRALQEIWMAEAKKDALAAFDAFVEAWGVKYDKAVECLIKDRDALLALRLPGRALEAPAHDQRHRKLVRHGAAWRWRLLSCGAIRTNKPAPRPLAIPLRTSESWRPSVAGYEHARGR
jgi:hypothetical protein